MSKTISELSPAELWQNFTALNAIPRASKKETAVINFIMDYGKSLNLQTQKDEVGNVIIKKPATAGMEDRQVVCLQSHLDMVHQKNADTDFDFATQGINMFIEDDWVKAKGTTLGADNGIGVAAIMAILAADNIPHPAIEALFTIDEETGMTGALGLKGGLLDAAILLNLDTEDDDELTIGCAGGIDVSAEGKYELENTPQDFDGFTLTVSGLTGGHSGMDIYKGRANANKVMNRILLNASVKFDLRVSAIDGGGLRNAIPRESVATIALPKNKTGELLLFIKDQEQLIKNENRSTDPGLKIGIEKTTTPVLLMNTAAQYALLRTIAACPNGIYRMSPEIEGLVQTSNNIARVIVKDGAFTIMCLTRGSVDSEKMELANTICYNFELAGAKPSYGGSYPGWAPNPAAPIVKLMSNLYKEMFAAEAHVNAVHAGLECGILGKNYPAMQMISFGPNIRGAHSPDEKVQVSSVQKFWKYLLETLKRIPSKN
ncbi:MAG: aminoacyl-histidine dipeptidase [Ferruginibacter sp.]|nr:aminoacyl-histidine dipeptidase [Bacteroidota bacterium]MBX2918933.1 aminoacyl-histidine dipeptidase [Ferruginibacter sp.]